MRWSCRLVLAVVAAFTCVAIDWGPGARAQGDLRVAVLPFLGPGGSQAEELIVAALPPGYTLAPAQQVDAAMAVATKQTNLMLAYAMIGRRVGAVALVEARVTVDGQHNLRVTVRRGNNGLSVGSVNFRGPGRRELLGVVRAQGPGWMKTLLERVAPAPLTAPAPAPVAARPEPRPSEPEPPATPMDSGELPPRLRKSAARPESARSATRRSESEPGETGISTRNEPDEGQAPFWEIHVGPRMLSRAFVFTDNLSGLPGYSLPGTLAVYAEAEVFPAARSKSPVRHIGFAGQWETAIGAKTLGRDRQRSHPTRTQSYRVGPRWRMRAGQFIVTLGGDYGEHKFNLDINEAIAPNVAYTLVRPSLGARFEVASGLSLGLTAAYLHILSVGGLGDENRFPRMTAKGAEVGGMIAYAFDPDFEVRLAADLRHYAHHMHVKPGDRFIVGGAVDEHFGGMLLISYRIR